MPEAWRARRPSATLLRKTTNSASRYPAQTHVRAQYTYTTNIHATPPGALPSGAKPLGADGKKMDAGGQRVANGSIAWHRDLTPNYKQWLEGDQAQEWPEGESKFTPTQVYFTGYFCTVSGNAEGIHDAIVANFARFEDAIKMAGIPAPTGSFISYVNITMSKSVT